MGIHPEDLLNLVFVELLFKFLASGIAVLVHLGTVCTTFSVAAKPAYHYRDSQKKTHTYDNLPPHKLIKVAMGDWFLHVTCAISELQIKNERGGSIENPGTSMLWSTNEISELMEHHGALFFVNFDMCEYGVSFKKFTRLLTNVAAFALLEKRCQRNHVREVLAGTSFDPLKQKWVSRTSLASVSYEVVSGLCYHCYRAF